jgi:hypothetical protein
MMSVYPTIRLMTNKMPTINVVFIYLPKRNISCPYVETAFAYQNQPSRSEPNFLCLRQGLILPRNVAFLQFFFIILTLYNTSRRSSRKNNYKCETTVKEVYTRIVGKAS